MKLWISKYWWCHRIETWKKIFAEQVVSSTGVGRQMGMLVVRGERLLGVVGKVTIKYFLKVSRGVL